MKKPSLSALRKKLDAVFSEWIRKRDAHGKDYAHCCTCNRAYPWKSMDCGHFIRRQHTAVRWTATNAHAQCKRCNLQGGEMVNYYQFMLRQYGQDVIDELQRRKHQAPRFRRADYKEMIRFHSQP